MAKKGVPQGTGKKSTKATNTNNTNKMQEGTTMTFISQPMDDHKEKELVPEGRYLVRVRDYKIKEREDGVMKSILVFHEIDGEPDAKDVVFNINLVLPEDDTDRKYWKLAFQKGYLRLFDVDWSSNGFDPNDLIGKEAEVDIFQETTPKGDVANRFDVNPLT